MPLRLRVVKCVREQAKGKEYLRTFSALRIMSYKTKWNRVLTPSQDDFFCGGFIFFAGGV